MTAASDTVLASVPALWDELDGQGGRRLPGSPVCSAPPAPDGLLLTAHLAGRPGWRHGRRSCPRGPASYPALTPRLGAAFWYEREIHDLFGVVPQGHPRLEPLILVPLSQPAPARNWYPAGRRRTRAGRAAEPRRGPGLFTIPHGPVRSGVVESIEYLVETPGEDIPHLNMRVLLQAPRHREAVRGHDRR